MLQVDITGEKVLQIREDATKGIYVYGLTEELVRSKEELENALIKGSFSRTTGSTLMNSESSRSHAIFSIIIQQKKVSQDSGNYCYLQYPFNVLRSFKRGCNF
jgi:hypothetical protein